MVRSFFDLLLGIYCLLFKAAGFICINLGKLILSFFRAYARSRAMRISVSSLILFGAGYATIYARFDIALLFLGLSAVSWIATLVLEPKKEKPSASVPQAVPQTIALPVTESVPSVEPVSVEETTPVRVEKEPLVLAEPSALCESVLQQEHVLIAGTTGSGKSVFLNSIIYNGMPKGDFYFIDPKRIDLRKWALCENCLGYAADADESLDILDEVEQTMWERLEHIPTGSERYVGKPIYLVIDEMAFLLSYGQREVIDGLSKIMRLGRAANIHVIAATQAPNRAKGGGIPAELAQVFTASVGLRCRSAIESRQVIGVGGCENLPRYGKGISWNLDGIKAVTIPMTSASELRRCADYYSE